MESVALVAIFLRTVLPSNWVRKTANTRGFCYLNLYAADRTQVAAHLLGAYPSWGDVKKLGGFKNHGAYYATMDSQGVYHIHPNGGTPWQELGIPDEALIGSVMESTFYQIMAIVGLIVTTPPFWCCILILWLSRLGDQGRVTFKLPKVPKVVYSTIFALVCLRSVDASLTYEDVSKALPCVPPPEIKLIHVAYLKSYVADRPEYEICTDSHGVRSSLVKLNMDLECKKQYIREICPTISKEDMWWKVLERIVARDDLLLLDTNVQSMASIGAKVDLVVMDGFLVVTEAVSMGRSIIAQILGVTAEAVKTSANVLLGSISAGVELIENHKSDPVGFVESVCSGVVAGIEDAKWKAEEVGRSSVKLVDTVIDGAMTTTTVALDKFPRPVQIVETVADSVDEVVDTTKLVGFWGMQRVNWTVAALVAVLDQFGTSTVNLGKSLVRASYDTDTLVEEVVAEVVKSRPWMRDKLGNLATDLPKIGSQVVETAVKVVDSAPWFSRTLGETVLAPFLVLASTLPDANAIGDYRRAVFGSPPDPGIIGDYRRALLGDWSSTVPWPYSWFTWLFAAGSTAMVLLAVGAFGLVFYQLLYRPFEESARVRNS